jgi:malonyl-CoA O-methyltransferase
LSERFPPLDARAARRWFARAAESYEGAARLEREVGARMLERLDYVKLAPRRILDAGSGPGREAPRLRNRYRDADIIVLDYALPMLTKVKTGWFQKRPLRVCADFSRLPLADHTVELVWCNLALHWANDPLAVFREFERVLSPEGLVLFSTLGPDTLKELRAAAGSARVHAFIDMHDLGDMLVAAGLTAPVMDMELISIDYRTGEQLLADLRGAGETNARADRPRGLSARGFLREFRAAPQRATFEVVYGHAWKRAPVDAGVKTVRVFKRLP